MGSFFLLYGVCYKLKENIPNFQKSVNKCIEIDLYGILLELFKALRNSLHSCGVILTIRVIRVIKSCASTSAQIIDF